jgi:hypothetical protein
LIWIVHALSRSRLAVMAPIVGHFAEKNHTH